MALHSEQFAHARRLAEALSTEQISEHGKEELVARIDRIQELTHRAIGPRPTARWYQSAKRVASADLKRRNRIGEEAFAATRSAFAQLTALKRALPDSGSGLTTSTQLTEIFLQLTKAQDSFSARLHRIGH